MFESMTDRIAGTVLMGLDVAVEFATLGEYRLVEADISPPPDSFQAAPLVCRPPRPAALATHNKLLPPASAAPPASTPSQPTTSCCRPHPRRLHAPRRSPRLA